MALDTAFLGKVDPNVNEQMMTAQQQIALAQALRGQSLQPIHAPGGQNGRISPLSAIAQVLNGYNAKGMMQDATHNLAGAESQMAQNRMAMMARMISGGADPQPSPAAPAPTASDDPPITLSSTPQASFPGAAPVPAPAPAAPSGPAAAPVGSVPTPMSDPQWQRIAMGEQLGMLPAGTADGYARAKYKNAELTEQQKNVRDPIAGGAVLGNLQTQNMTELQKLQAARSQVPDGSPRALELDAAIKKANYVAPAQVAPGHLALDRNNTPLAYNPPAIPGAIPQFTTAGGFTTAPSVMPQGGAAGVNAGYEGARTNAVQRNSVHTATGPDGAPQTGFLFGGGQGGATPQARPAATAPAGLAPTPGAPAAAVPPPRNAGVIVGPSSTDQAIQKTSADTIAQAPQVVQQSRSAITGLEAAQRALQGVRATGPGTARTNEIVSAINNAMGTHIDGNSNDAYQSVAKLLSNSLNAAAQHTGAGGSDARFESFMHGQPNNDSMNIAPLQGAIRYVLSQHDANAARGQFLQDAYAKAKAAGDPNAALTAQAQWAQMYKPDFFAFNRMSPEEHTQYLQSLGSGAADFVKQYNNYAKQTGWVR